MKKFIELDVIGQEHWASKGSSTKLFLWNKFVGDPINSIGTLVFVHGSSMASQPTFDLHIEGRPFSSAMNYFAIQGFDTWCVDMEGYGRSDKDRDSYFFISDGADDLGLAMASGHAMLDSRPRGGLMEPRGVHS